MEVINWVRQDDNKLRITAELVSAVSHVILIIVYGNFRCHFKSFVEGPAFMVQR